jgi:Putative NADPH-quinone reductase (modulator of drug activity B)
MNHLIVFAHPNQKSFCKGIVDTIENASKEKGDNICVRDLYEIGFDPILKPSDFVALQSGNIPEDIKTEQEHVKWADIITFVYPVWWVGLPAMLKGYVDRVFSYGFAYESVNGAPRGLLTGKKALVFCTTGTPNEVYEQNGMHNSMKQTTGAGIFGFTGIEEIKHTFFGAVPYLSEDSLKEYLKEVEKIVREDVK